MRTSRQRLLIRSVQADPIRNFIRIGSAVKVDPIADDTGVVTLLNGEILQVCTVQAHSVQRIVVVLNPIDPTVMYLHLRAVDPAYPRQSELIKYSQPSFANKISGAVSGPSVSVCCSVPSMRILPMVEYLSVSGVMAT